MHHARIVFFIFLIISVIVNTLFLVLGFFEILYSLFFILPITCIGLFDLFQRKKTILRNFPVIGHFRYLFESIRPEIYQYFVESDINGKPFSRDMRSIVYQRSKNQLSTRPFGTQLDIYNPGYEWVNHSINPVDPCFKKKTVKIGNQDCAQPYDASLLNISAMSYGSLSAQAILALNGGAKLGGFAHNTGEGGLSEYHQKKGGDLIWQIGTAYFGCRDENGNFDPEKFKDKAQSEQIKMIEIKISQGAKPGHGGILPSIKNTPEIAKIRGVEPHTTVYSPSYHRAFTSPLELCEFIAQLRDCSKGKPIGIKLCLGKRHEFIALCKAIIETKVAPDYIVIDGGEGGTGAAPLEFQNRIGCPLREGLIFAHNALTGFSLRKEIKIIASGCVISSFDILMRLAIGADICYSARGMMFALGCIQALQCNSNKCPTGVASHKKYLTRGLVVEDKEQRVFNFHKNTMESFSEMIAAMGLRSHTELRPWHIMRRPQPSVIKNYHQLVSYLEDGELLSNKPPMDWQNFIKGASSKSFSFYSKS